MQVRLTELARLELLDACTWYDEQQSGLGARFATGLRTSARRIARMPLLYPIEIADVRKCPLNRFPYVLRYVLRDAAIVIVAVSHQHRTPDYWIDRLDEP